MDEEFLDRKKTFAVVGASENKEKWGFKVYASLRNSGFKVFGVNPNCHAIEGEKCYPNLKSLPEKPDIVITVVPPSVTEEIVKETKELGIKRVWMQPGSESEKAIEFCRRNNISVVANSCFLITHKDVLK
ncbi:MAG: CoA-binding protein [Candidatus Woesearchaeota archaeon]